MNSLKGKFKKLINLFIEKSFCIQSLILVLFFSGISIAQEKTFEGGKNYLISQSMKFGNDPFKNVFFFIGWPTCDSFIS